MPVVKHKALTDFQKAALQKMLAVGLATYTDLSNVGATGATSFALVKMGLAEVQQLPGESWKTWRITLAGRAALEAGTFTVEN